MNGYDSRLSGRDRKEDRAGTFGPAPEFKQETLHFGREQIIRQGFCAGTIYPGDFLGIRLHHDERAPHNRVALDKDFHAGGRHQAGLRGNVAHHHVGVVGPGKLENVEFRNGIITNNPIALGFRTSQAPQGVDQFATADSLKINKMGFGRGNLSQCGGAVRQAADMEQT